MPSALFVDDDQSLLESLRHRLRDTRWSVAFVCSGEHARQLLGAIRFDVVCSGRSVPGVDGSALLDEARRISPRTGTILMVPVGSQEEESPHWRVLKPIQVDELVWIIESALG